MGQEKAKRLYNSLWPISRFWHNCRSILGRYIDAKGFTLVELILVIVILGILSSVLVSKLDPFGQINKSHDAKRQYDLTQLKIALDAYYNDHNRYPITLAGLTTYIKDSSIEANYPYAVDNNNPHWNVLFAKLSRTESAQTSCALRSLESCTPSNFNDFWACSISGKVDCRYLASLTLPSSGIVPTSTPAPPTPTLTPTPTPEPVRCAGGTTQLYADTSMVGCNGSKTLADAVTLCSVGSHVCTAEEYVQKGGGITRATSTRWLSSRTDGGFFCSAENMGRLPPNPSAPLIVLAANVINKSAYTSSCSTIDSSNTGYFSYGSPTIYLGTMCCSGPAPTGGAPTPTLLPTSTPIPPTPTRTPDWMCADGSTKIYQVQKGSVYYTACSGAKTAAEASTLCRYNDPSLGVWHCDPERYAQAFHTYDSQLMDTPYWLEDDKYQKCEGVVTQPEDGSRTIADRGSVGSIMATAPTKIQYSNSCSSYFPQDWGYMNMPNQSNRYGALCCSTEP